MPIMRSPSAACNPSTPPSPAPNPFAAGNGEPPMNAANGTSDGRGIKGEGLRESEERFPRKVTSRVEPLNCSSRRESALLFPKRRWSGLTSAATRFMERARVSCRTPRAVSVDILLPKIQNRHLCSRLLLAPSSRLRELHDTNESATVVADETRSQRRPRQTKSSHPSYTWLARHRRLGLRMAR